jgi:hypothetical protein
MRAIVTANILAVKGLPISQFGCGEEGSDSFGENAGRVRGVLV